MKYGNGTANVLLVNSRKSADLSGSFVDDQLALVVQAGFKVAEEVVVHLIRFFENLTSKLQYVRLSYLSSEADEQRVTKVGAKSTLGQALNQFNDSETISSLDTVQQAQSVILYHGVATVQCLLELKMSVRYKCSLLTSVVHLLMISMEWLAR